MNIIDRSPLKMTTQEALYSQCSRRINEAKTEEEKAAIVQNFAEQLRLEKLRAKRLKENLREMNNAIVHSPGGAEKVQLQGSSATTSSKLTTTSNTTDVGQGGVKSSKPATAAWLGPYSANFELFSNDESGAVETPASEKTGQAEMSFRSGSTVHNAGDLPTQPTMKRRLSDVGSAQSNGLRGGVTPLPSRPLNVNAVPFVPGKPPAIGADTAQSNGQERAGRVSSRRVSEVFASPVAVAPKGVKSLDPSSVGHPLVQMRPRSSSTGPLPQTTEQPKKSPSCIDGSPVNTVSPASQNGMLFSPTSESGLRQLDKMDGFPKSYFQSDKKSSVERDEGYAKIENIRDQRGPSLLKNEDWDLEDSQEERPQQEAPDIKRTGRRSVRIESGKDWLTILKERDDMAKRRYSREKMLQLYVSDASKNRPSCLPTEYYNEVGLWSPDLWFHDKFQSTNQRPAQPQRIRPNVGRGGSVVNGFGPAQLESSGMRRISCLSAFQEKKCENEPRCSSR